MSRTTNVAVLSLIIAVIPGCTLFKSAYRVDPVVVAERGAFDRELDNKLNGFRQAYRAMTGTPAIQAIVLNEYVFPENDAHPRGGGKVRQQTPNKATGCPAGKVCECEIDHDEPSASENDLAYWRAHRSKADRNRLAQQIVSLSNDMCVMHMSGFVSQQALNELVLGSASLGLTAAGAVVTGGASVLSAAATGVGGTRTLVNDTVYYKQLTPALVKRAFAERNKLLTMISAKLQVSSLSKYEVTCLRDACKANCEVSPSPDTSDAEHKKKPPSDDEKKACRAQCDTKLVFPCPHVLQLDVKEAREAEKQAEKAAKDADDKVKRAASAPAMKSAMEERAAAENKLTEKTKGTNEAKDDAQYCRLWTDYSIDDAIADLKQLHDACSFYHTLAQSVEEIQKVADKINSELDAIYKSSAKDAAKGNKPVTAGANDTHDQSAKKTSTSKPAAGGGTPPQ